MWARWFRRQPQAAPLDPREAYELWAPSYPPLAHNGLMQLEERTLLGLLPEIAGSVALDVGCGSGRYLRLLGERGALRTFGCDLAPAMLARARALEPRLVLGDAAALPFAGARFDLVLAGLVVGHCADLGQVIRELGRVLRPGGVLAYTDIHPLGTLAGWERSFVDPAGRERVVRQHLHLPSDHLRALQAAGLQLEALEEPSGEQAGRFGNWPALLALRARKPS